MAARVTEENQKKKREPTQTMRIEEWKIALFAVCMRCHSHVLQLVQYSIFIDVKQALTGKTTW